MKKVLLTYIGLRPFGEATACPTFLEGKDKKVYFSKVKYVRIGDLYEMTDDKMSTRPESKGRAKVDDEQIDKWRSEEFAAEQWARHQRGIKKANKIKIKNLDLDQLYTMASKLDYETQKHFVERVKKYILFGRD